MRNLANLPVSLALPCTSISHTDVINNTDVETILFVDSKSHGTFGIDASYVEMNEWANNPFNNGRILLSNVNSAQVKDKHDLTADDVGRDLLNLMALSALYIHFDAQSPAYHASEGEPHDGINLLNTIATLAQSVLRICDPDTADSDLIPGEPDELMENPWFHALYRCTGLEYAQIILEAGIALLSPLLPAEWKLFVVLPEPIDPTDTSEPPEPPVPVDWATWVNNLLQNKGEDQDAELWLESAVTKEEGWSDDELAVVRGLNVGSGAISWSDLQLHIFRIR